MPLTEGDLGQFIGSMEWTRHPLCRNVIYSEGMAFVAERGKAYWLIDAIASHEAHNPKLKAACRNDESFDYLHFWILKVNQETKAWELTCIKDTGEKPVVVQTDIYTDFPFSIKIYAGNDGPGTLRKLFLPSEY